MDMASAQQLIGLVKSHAEGDSDRFFDLAMQLSAAEEQKGHKRLAETLRQWANAGLALSQGLAAKEIQIYVKNPDVMLLLDQQDWSGRIKSSMNDYLRVVDANIGANKSNYYVDRSTEYSINVDRNSRLQGVVKISWQHRGTSGTWPGGDLTNYVRVYTPLGAKLQSSKEFDTQELQSYVENGKQVFAGRVKIPYNNTKTVELSYALPSRLGILESSGQYNLLWQKQSGVVDEPLKISFNTPVFLEVEHVSTSGKMQDGSIVWQQVANTDQDFQLTLRQ